MRYGANLLLKTDFLMEKTEIFYHRQAREISIDGDPPQRVIGDGEEWGQTPINIKVLPQAARFLVAAASS